MATKKKNGFKLKTSGHADQIVLLCHGGWVPTDGATTVPEGLTICFYAGHGHFTVGQSVYNAVCKHSVHAHGGLLKRVDMAEEDLSLLAESRGKSVDAMREIMLDQATGVYDSFGGGNPMFNYALSREPKGARYDAEKRLFNDHAKLDVDLMMMSTTSGRHLSDVFKMIKDMGYQTLHFGACRVPYGSTPSEVAA